MDVDIGISWLKWSKRAPVFKSNPVCVPFSMKKRKKQPHFVDPTLHGRRHWLQLIEIEQMRRFLSFFSPSWSMGVFVWTKLLTGSLKKVPSHARTHLHSEPGYFVPLRSFLSDSDGSFHECKVTRVFSWNSIADDRILMLIIMMDSTTSHQKPENWDDSFL